jgi:uncharacterized protein YjbI with pentapeptide repeats
LSLANLKAADFTGAILRGTNFQSASIEGVIFINIDATGADFRLTNFTDVDLAGNVIVELILVEGFS